MRLCLPKVNQSITPRDREEARQPPLSLSQRKHPSGRQSPTSKVNGGCFKRSAGSQIVSEAHPMLTQRTGKGGAVIYELEGQQQIGTRAKMQHYLQ